MADDLRRLIKKERILWNLLESLDDFLEEYEAVQDQDIDLENEDADDEARAIKKETRRKENAKVFKEFVNRSLIHDNELLNQMDKFNYLRTSLRDDALLQINQIQVSAINYNLAWSVLESKYENHKLIAQEHMKALLAAPAMQIESFEGLNALLTTFKTNLQQLEKLGLRTSDWSTLLAFMLSQKLDTETYRLWETHHASKDVPSFEAMAEFLENLCSILQSTASRNIFENQWNSRIVRVVPVRSVDNAITTICIHILRIKIAGQISQASLKPLEDLNARIVKQEPPPTNTPTVSHHTTTLLSTQQNTHTAILSTAIVKLADSNGNTVSARALLDNGSQICLMTEDLSKKLNFVRFRESLPVKGVGGCTNVSKESVLARVLSCTSPFTTAERKFYVLPQITLDLPQSSINVSTWKLPPSISLADPEFNQSSPVDIVIGVSLFYDVLLPNQMKIDDAGLMLQNTRLGWIVAGELPETPI
ncbi:uncharacterized protein LOC129760517, partial [Uranotaenia lowii]|uniref:uncharacterized protein LOC129760517 n=1 Tax=Uranotaenia lowii TaxID=190385 RepID=UPI002478AFCA